MENKSLVGVALFTHSPGYIAVTDSEGFGHVENKTFEQILGAVGESSEQTPC